MSTTSEVPEPEPAPALAPAPEPARPGNDVAETVDEQDGRTGSDVVSVARPADEVEVVATAPDAAVGSLRLARC